MAIRMQRSSGNVFADIGFPRKEAAHLLIRSDLMIQLTNLIDDRGLTQKQAAEALGVTQPRISNLVRGRTPRPRVLTAASAAGRMQMGSWCAPRGARGRDAGGSRGS